MSTNENTNDTKDTNDAPIAEVSATEAEAVAGGIKRASVDTGPIFVPREPTPPLES